MCPVLSERLFYYVVLMSIILKPRSNFRASHGAIHLEAHKCAETQGRQSVSQSVPHYSAAVTVPSPQLLSQSFWYPPAMPTWQPSLQDRSVGASAVMRCWQTRHKLASNCISRANLRQTDHVANIVPESPTACCQRSPYWMQTLLQTLCS
jgi:hypothetical protein